MGTVLDEKRDRDMAEGVEKERRITEAMHQAALERNRVFIAKARALVEALPTCTQVAPGNGPDDTCGMPATHGVDDLDGELFCGTCVSVPGEPVTIPLLPYGAALLEVFGQLAIVDPPQYDMSEWPARYRIREFPEVRT